MKPVSDTIIVLIPYSNITTIMFILISTSAKYTTKVLDQRSTGAFQLFDLGLHSRLRGIELFNFRRGILHGAKDVTSTVLRLAMIIRGVVVGVRTSITTVVGGGVGCSR